MTDLGKLKSLEFQVETQKSMAAAQVDALARSRDELLKAVVLFVYSLPVEERMNTINEYLPTNKDTVVKLVNKFAE